MNGVKIFQKARQAGGQMLDNGCVYSWHYSKYNPQRLIQRTIAPNGSYAIQVSENGQIIKRVNKTFLNGSSTITDSWDFTKNKGIHLSKVDVVSGESELSRVYDKVTEKGINQDGFIYLYRKGDNDKYIAKVRTLDGITSTPKPFSPFAWLNDQFYKLFNK